MFVSSQRPETAPTRDLATDGWEKLGENKVAEKNGKNPGGRKLAAGARFNFPNTIYVVFLLKLPKKRAIMTSVPNALNVLPSI